MRAVECSQFRPRIISMKTDRGGGNAHDRRNIEIGLALRDQCERIALALGSNARAALGYDGRSSGGLTTHAGRVTVRVGF